MAFFWGKAATVAAISARLERLRESERALIELAFDQKDCVNDTSTALLKTANPLPPIIEAFDTCIPVSCIHDSDPTTDKMGEISSNIDRKCDELYRIHGISITSQNENEKFKCCDKPLVLLHGYSESFLSLCDSEI